MEGLGRAALLAKSVRMEELQHFIAVRIDGSGAAPTQVTIEAVRAYGGI